MSFRHAADVVATCLALFSTPALSQTISYMGPPHVGPLYKMTILVERANYVPSTGLFEWTALVNFEKLPMQDDEVWFDIFFEIVQTEKTESTIKIVKLSCSGGYGGCDTQTTVAGLVPAGFEFAGFGVNRIVLESFSGPLKVSGIGLKMTGIPQSNGSVLTMVNCSLHDAAATNVMGCTASGVALAILDKEVNPLHVSKYDPGETSSFVDFYLDPVSPQGKMAICGLEGFKLKRTPDPLTGSNLESDIWAVAAGTGRDCGYNGGIAPFGYDVAGNLGDNHPGFPFPPGSWTTTLPFDAENHLLESILF